SAPRLPMASALPRSAAFLYQILAVWQFCGTAVAPSLNSPNLFMAFARTSSADLRYQFEEAGQYGATPGPYLYRLARLFMEAALPSAAAFSYQCLAFAKSCGISRPSSLSRPI